ncbi:hypothetical protein BC938DRAFT_478339, partial [Jimgerdemannia flammicorona]
KRVKRIEASIYLKYEGYKRDNFNGDITRIFLTANHLQTLQVKEQATMRTTTALLLVTALLALLALQSAAQSDEGKLGIATRFRYTLLACSRTARSSTRAWAATNPLFSFLVGQWDCCTGFFVVTIDVEFRLDLASSLVFMHTRHSRNSRMEPRPEGHVHRRGEETYDTGAS